MQPDYVTSPTGKQVVRHKGRRAEIPPSWRDVLEHVIRLSWIGVGIGALLAVVESDVALDMIRPRS